MGVLRTALALGALAMSLPLGAQGSRYGWDRGRTERNRDARSGTRNESRTDDRSGNRAAPRGENRVAERNDSRTAPRIEHRGPDRDGARNGSRFGSIPDIRTERREHREPPRVDVRPPVIIRRDGRDLRFDNRYQPYGRHDRYRWDDRDFRQHEVLRITAWFRNIGPSRLSFYGLHDRGWYDERYDFRPGLLLSMSLLARLDVLPFELEVELGDLPWYLERRIYGRTVLIIDTRTRVVVDLYDIDW